MESPVTVKLHESLKNVEDRTCLVLDDDGPFLQRLARALTQRGDLVTPRATGAGRGSDGSVAGRWVSG